ncbi:serine hydrolase [Zunongwangia sp. H14]|uniref:serine hydrolase n=1 Tax=Zunongwangia sp. H14 TaxID=3240792 RepID=UPI003561AA33
MIKKYVILFIALLMLNSTQAQSVLAKEITKGQSYRDSLPPEGVHQYILKLDSSQFVFGHVYQKTLDVVVSVINPENKEIASFDGPARGPENFRFESKRPGNYTIKVKPFKEATGLYEIKIETAEPVAIKPEERVDQLMAEFSGKNVPGAAVMLMKNGKIIFSEGYGMANLAYNIPFTTDTPTNIGSTSKQFTAFAIELLAKQGKLSLDDDVRKYFPEFPEFQHKVSIRNLLTHTSGYREFLNTLAMTGRDLTSPLDQKMILKIIQNQPELQNEPGAQWNYNNTGFAILAALVERVTNEAFPVWMEKNVFKPLNMNHTLVRKNQYEVVKNRSVGYNIAEGGNFQEVQDLGGAMGAGGIYTTMEDLAKWIRNLKDPKVGNKEIIKEMTTPFVLKNGDTTQYGLGLFITNYRGLKQIQHGGADVAHRSMLMYFPEIDAAVVTQSNNAGFAENLAYQISDAFFSDYMKAVEEEENNKEEFSGRSYDYDVARFDDLTGRYELAEAPGFILTFSRDGDRIYTQATGQGEVDLYAVSDSLFKLKGVDAEINFHINNKGTADSLTLNQHGKHLAKKLQWKPDAETLKEYTGHYFSKEIETMYSIEMEEEELVLRNYQIAEPMPLYPADKDSFGSSFPISGVSFKRNEKGEISGFSASNGRTKGVIFTKINRE